MFGTINLAFPKLTCIPVGQTICHVLRLTTRAALQDPGCDDSDFRISFALRDISTNTKDSTVDLVSCHRAAKAETQCQAIQRGPPAHLVRVMLSHCESSLTYHTALFCRGNDRHITSFQDSTEDNPYGIKMCIPTVCNRGKAWYPSVRI